MTPQGFEFVPFSQRQLHDALRQMCPAALKAYDAATTKQMRIEYASALTPTRFCCYFVSETVFWYAEHVTIPMALPVPGDSTLHRYGIVNGTDKRIDLTCDQFDFELDYKPAKPRMFLQTGGRGPSKRAQELAFLLKMERKR